MRTVTEKFVERLEAQAKEAEIQGLKKVSVHLTRLVKESKVRPNSDAYSYFVEDLKEDVEKPLWDAVVRVADYYDCDVDGVHMQQIIEKISVNLIDEVRLNAKVKHGIGAYESTVPGETREVVLLEVE